MVSVKCILAKYQISAHIHFSNNFINNIYKCRVHINIKLKELKNKLLIMINLLKKKGVGQWYIIFFF